MTSNIQMWLSAIDYRPDSTAPNEGKIPLGVIVEAASASNWIVAVQVRAFLVDEELACLDGVGKELLRQPQRVVTREIESALSRAKVPGDVLKLLSQNALWSLHVGVPRKEKAPPRKKLHEGALGKLQSLYASHVGGVITKTTKQSGTPTTAVAPWARPAREWQVPIHASV